MKFFLTGATGFVGSALLNRFVVDGCKVGAFVRNESVVFPDGVKKVVGDLSGFVEDCHVADVPRNDSYSVGDPSASLGML